MELFRHSAMMLDHFLLNIYDHQTKAIIALLFWEHFCQVNPGYAFVAHLDRVTDFESVGSRFESCRTQFCNSIQDKELAHSLYEWKNLRVAFLHQSVEKL